MVERDYPLTLYGICEDRPGPRWQALYDAVWPAYRAWFLSEGTAARADLATSRAMLDRHLPELVGTWERLVELARGDETAARMLALWRPPTFLPGCSQAVVTGARPALVRNYDYAPRLFEQVCYSSRFAGRRVIGTGDCLWGLLDGMNDDGLAVSLAFGGRPGSGPGFGIPLVVRYVLEAAGTTSEARRILARVPVSMAYNLTIVDARGDTTTAFVAPGAAGRVHLGPGSDEPPRSGAGGSTARPPLPQRGTPGPPVRAGRRRHRPGSARRCLPRAAAAQHGLRARVRDAVYRGLPAGRAVGGVPLAGCLLAAYVRLARRDHDGPAPRVVTERRPARAPCPA